MKLAVYGTLREGQGNWSYFLKDKTKIGTFRLSGYSLHSCGAFPYAVHDEDGVITVEIYDIETKDLYRCDSLEGFPSHYDREEIVVDGHKAWIYFAHNEERIKGRFPKIESGDWLENV